MKILFFVRDLGLGGVERCVSLVAEGLAASGFEVTIALLGGSRNLWEKNTANVRVVDLSPLWHGKRPWTWLAGWRAARRLAKEADVVIAATFLMPLYMAWAATIGLKKRLIGWVHGPMAELDAFARMNPIHRAACQFIYRRLPETLCVSDHTRQSLARWLGMPIQPGWLVMPNFVEPSVKPREAPSPQPSPARGEGALVDTSANLPPSPLRGRGDGGEGREHPLQLLFVGRIAEEKQPHLWLDTLEALAARGLPSELTVLGAGPMQEWVKNEAARRRLAVHFHGQVGGVEDFMRRADWLLLTSNFEGFGLVVLEAMQVGLPVVSTDSGGVNDFFAGRVSEFVVNEATGQALAAKIAEQLPHHAEIGAWLCERAKNYAPAVLLKTWARLLSNR
ncbi:Glycosyltransferase involved in cell wall bisynthesis [Formivibrio citricus]|uniref:Glycosyltransferase involved in cell wall bisynthesis n=1 Tax=Formivibrio citricus TaxID=83765 RepID=A0A1I5CBH9_9NEIS|nr:glycosyltransferase [Formivibrio citricus]SFN84224.1 Glycosyltransferase involved in cell wall bisynthesis [Formivibrio citricus]